MSTLTVNGWKWVDEAYVPNLCSSAVKPKAPTIVSVNVSNGNFEVQWRTNIRGYFSESLTASVTYYKKGDTEKVA